MNRLRSGASPSGVSLLELLMGMVIGGIVVWGVMRVFEIASKSSATANTQNQNDTSAELVGLNLKSKLGGIKNFQNLSLAIAAGKQSAGPGIYVQPDTDINGVASAGNDRLSMVVAVPTPTELRIDGNVGPGAPKLFLRTSDGTTPVANIVQSQKYLVLTTVQRSEIVKAIGNLNSLVSPNTYLSLSSGNFTNTFIPSGGPSTFSGTYVSGDLVNVAELVSFGLDPSTHTLLMTGSTPSPQIIGTNVTNFSVSYLMAPGALCGALIFPSTPSFQRDSATWTALNSNDQNQCYKRISQYQIQFTQNGKPGSFTFNSNQ